MRLGTRLPVVVVACSVAVGVLEGRVPAADLTRDLSLQLEKRPLRALLEAVGAACSIEIVAESLVLDRPVAVIAKNTPAWRVLQAASEQAGIFWHLDDGTLLVSDRTGRAGEEKDRAPFEATALASQDVLAFIASLGPQQRNVLLQGHVLAWKSLKEPQAELVLSVIKRLHPGGLPWSIGSKRNVGMTEGVALVFDPYVEYRLEGKPAFRVFFRAHPALESLMSVKPSEDGLGFVPLKPLSRALHAAPAPIAAEAPQKGEHPARPEGRPQTYSMAKLVETAFPAKTRPIPLPPLGQRAVTVFGLKRDAAWLFDRAVNCLGARASPFGAARALFVPSSRLREGWKRELQFPPPVGLPRVAVTRALEPFMATVDLEAEGCPFPLADFLSNARFDSEQIQGRPLAFLLAKLPQDKAKEVLNAETGRFNRCEVRLGTSVLLAEFGYGEDRFGSGPLRAAWTCFIQIQSDYGERLPQVIVKGWQTEAGGEIR